MRQFIERTVLAEVAHALDVPKVRVAGIAAQMMGVALLRYVIELPPLADADDDEIVALLAPVAQYYLEGRKPSVARRRLETGALSTPRSRPGHPIRLVFRACADSSRWPWPPSPC